MKTKEDSALQQADDPALEALWRRYSVTALAEVFRTWSVLFHDATLPYRALFTSGIPVPEAATRENDGSALNALAAALQDGQVPFPLTIARYVPHGLDLARALRDGFQCLCSMRLQLEVPLRKHIMVAKPATRSAASTMRSVPPSTTSTPRTLTKPQHHHHHHHHHHHAHGRHRHKKFRTITRTGGFRGRSRSSETHHQHRELSGPSHHLTPPVPPQQQQQQQQLQDFVIPVLGYVRLQKGHSYWKSTNWLSDFFTEDLRFQTAVIDAAAPPCVKSATEPPPSRQHARAQTVPDDHHPKRSWREVAASTGRSPPSRSDPAAVNSAHAQSQALTMVASRPSCPLSYHHPHVNCPVKCDAWTHWHAAAPAVLSGWQAHWQRRRRGGHDMPRLLWFGLQREAVFQAAAAQRYRPVFAKTMYELAHATCVLDLCAGWGDRLLAALATPCVREYIAVDPNSLLHPRYFDMQHVLDPARTCLLLRCIARPAEDLVLDTDIRAASVDCVFLSPPGLAHEVYRVCDPAAPAEDQTRHHSAQIAVRYGNNMAKFLQDFLRPVLKLAAGALRPGGVLIMDLTDLEQSPATSSHAAARPSQLRYDVFALAAAVAPQLHLEHAVVFQLWTKSGQAAEVPRPLFVWRKTGTPPPRRVAPRTSMMMKAAER